LAHLNLLGVNLQDFESGFNVWEGNVDTRVETTRANQCPVRRE